MVKVRETLPKTAAGKVDTELWLQQFQQEFKQEEIKLLQAALEQVQQAGANHTVSNLEQTCQEQGMVIAEILFHINCDAITVTSGLLSCCFNQKLITLEKINQIDQRLSPLLQELQKLENMHAKPSANHNNLLSERTDNLRRMLLAVVKDLRVVLIKLAERTAVMRACSKLDDAVKQKLALEAQHVFAPIANRLGIGQIKWELEDLTFRFLEPEIYKHIAKLLDEKRLDREKYIKDVISTLKQELKINEIEAKVQGRVKHIYSIWRKMRRKNLSYDDIYDVRAVRVLVTNIKECYAALGVVHSLWHHIPKEFDDYIANPKENGYRSLHTAVIGPNNKNLEIQIRTFEMHDESELGFASHWRYKEGGKSDADYENKIASVRQILEQHEDLGDPAEEEEALRAEIFVDRVYVFTPKGEVIDLPAGATPIDFAYAVHSEVGHKCRGAKVNGKMVTLNHELSSGDQVEIITAKNAVPSRDWLNPHLNFIKSSRTRSKIQQWFKRQGREESISEGKEIIEKEIKRLGLTKVDFDIIAEKFNLKTKEDLYGAVGANDIRLSQVITAIETLHERQQKTLEQQKQLDLERLQQSKSLAKRKKRSATDVTVVGVSDILVHMAKCCKPVPGDDIIGLITKGRGISVHRKNCKHILEITETHEERLLEVEWGNLEDSTNYLVDIMLVAHDRQGLLRDVAATLSMEKVNVLAVNTKSDIKTNRAFVRLSVEVRGLNQLSLVMTKLNQIPSVIEVARVS